MTLLLASVPAPIFLAGPTASGKSAVAIELALHRGGEILSVDSMQVYRGLDIGTSKPSLSDRARVPHHLIDLVGLRESFDAARWLDAAKAAHVDVGARGQVPVFCGGTGLYFRAWFEGLASVPPANPALRAELESMEPAVLLAELEAWDPEACARIDRANPRRVVRAVEILRLTGGVLPRRDRDAVAEDARPPLVVLRRTADDLRARIEARVDAMFAAGLVEETRALLRQGLASNRSAMQAIGYRQVVEHLGGERDLAGTVALVKTRTWQYARRQLTWFRHQHRVVWLDVPPQETPEATAERVRRLVLEFGAAPS